MSSLNVSRGHPTGTATEVLPDSSQVLKNSAGSTRPVYTSPLTYHHQSVIDGGLSHEVVGSGTRQFNTSQSIVVTRPVVQSDVARQ